MPVVINDFEIVPEPPPPPASADTTGPVESPAEPLDVERMLADHRLREARVRAY